MSKTFAVFGFILLAALLTLSIVFSHAIFMGVDNETQWEHPGVTIGAYEQTEIWSYLIAFILVCFSIVAALLLLT